jgi:SAM-dependent methyltransferase
MPFLISSKAAKRDRREAWQHVSLVAGFLAGRHFVGANDLHYGYWRDDIEPIIRNLPRAQDEYSKFILSHIPTDAHRILDIGSGAGGLASKLIARGHVVDCVSPCTFLNEQARALCGDRVRIFDCEYEKFETTEKYDAVVFCESFQYVNMEQGLARVASQLRSGGSLVICDFFRKVVDGNAKSPISGGYPFHEFQEIVSRFPLRVVEDIDITDYTAPTFTVIDRAFTDVLAPIWDEIDSAATTTRPTTSRFVKWLFKGKLAKVRTKYFTHERSAENFTKFKTYRLLRYVRD